MDDAVEQFSNHVREGVKSWVLAGKLLLQMQMKDAKVFNKIIAKNEWLSIDALMTFARIGRMELRPEILLMPNNAGNKIARLGYSQQCKLLDGRVKVAVEIDRNGRALIQEKKISEMTGRDLDTLIEGSKTRTIIEQEQYLHGLVTAKIKAKEKPFVQKAFEKPVSEKKLMLLGCWRIVWRHGQPTLTKAATLPMNAQRIMLQDNMGDVDAFIELTRWSEA